MNEVHQHQSGYIFLKGASWYLRYRVNEVQPDGTVKQVQRCRKLAANGGQYRSKKAVKTLADEFLAPFNNGTVTAESSMSVVDFWDSKYLPYITSQKTPSTVNGYTKMWAHYLQARVGMPLREFRTVDCERMLHVIAAKYNVSGTTLKHVKHLLSGIFRYAIRTGALNGINPVQASSIPKAKPGKKTHAYTLEQILGMLAVLPQPQRRLLRSPVTPAFAKGS